MQTLYLDGFNDDLDAIRAELVVRDIEASHFAITSASKVAASGGRGGKNINQASH
jgi:hypothetical protein